MQSQYGSSSQAAAPVLKYLGVGRRFLALIIDAIILVIILLIVSWIIGMIFHSSIEKDQKSGCWNAKSLSLRRRKGADHDDAHPSYALARRF